MGFWKKNTEYKDKDEDEEDSHFATILKNVSGTETDGLLNAIDEQFEDVKERLENIQGESSGDEEEQFLEPGTVPVNLLCTDGAHLFTAAEVSNALQRDNTKATNNISDSNARPVQKTSNLRSRFGRDKKRGSKRGEDNQTNQNGELNLFGTPSKPFKWGLGYYLESVASTREKRIIALSAWLLSVAGLIVALAFVTKDFVDSRTNMSSVVRYTFSDELEIPAIWLCDRETALPLFADYPHKDFPGPPLIWIDFIRGTSSNLNLTYPATRNLSQLHNGSYDINGKACKPKRKMDVTVFLKELREKPVCFNCFVIERKPGFIIKSSGSYLSKITNISNRMGIRVSHHTFFSRCKTSQMGLARDVFRFFREEIKKHADELEKKGILDFGNQNATDNMDDQYLWPLYRFGFRNTSYDFVVYDVVDMFCNVYLFSNHFYPSTSTDVKFKFNSDVFRWERSGRGPYYPPHFEDFYQNIKQAEMFSMGGKIGSESLENRTVYAGNLLSVMTNLTQTSELNTLAVLHPNEVVSVGLKRSLIEERELFNAQVLSSDIEPGDVRAFNFVYYVDIGFNSFMTRVVSKQQSVSWTAFVADFFGWTSLFLDVSVYTLIIAPLIMKARKRAMEDRKRTKREEAASQAAIV